MPVMTTGESDSSVDVLVKSQADTAGITQTTAALDEMSAKAKTQADTSASSFEKFNTALGKVSGAAVKVGTSMTEYVTLPIAGVAYESVKMATQFQQTMELLHTNAGTAQGDIKGLSDQILAMAPKVGAGPEALATAMYHIASAGNGLWSTSQQLNILQTAAEGAAIGQANLDDTTYALTSALASNVKGAKDASEMMATLNAIVGSGDMKLQDLNAAIGTGFLGTAATFGISIQSVGAALATLTDNGEHADAAATRLRMTWALMTSPSKQAAGLLQDLGLTAEDAATSTAGMSEVFAKTGLTTTKMADDLRQPNGMTVALRDLSDHLQKAGLSASETDAILSKTFGGGRTDAALLTMLQNLDRMDVKFKAINEGTSQFGANWAAQQQTANQQFKEAWAGIEASLIKLGDVIMPEASKLMKEFSGDIQAVASWFEKLTPKEQDFILKTAGIAAVAGPTLLIFGKLGQSVSELGNLFLTANKMMGMFKTTEVVAEAAKGAEALGTGAGLEGAAAAAIPEVGGLAAALGPVAIGIGAIAAVGIGAAIVVNKISDAHKAAAKNAQDEYAAEQKLTSQLQTSQGAQTQATKLVNDYTNATVAETKANNAKYLAYSNLQKVQGEYNITVAATAAALKKYGPDSNQYMDALAKEANAQQQLTKATDAWNKVADAAKNAHDKVKVAASDLNATYYTGQSLTQKLASDSDNLTKAKDKEAKAHQATYDAAHEYAAALQLLGPSSKQTEAAAVTLTQKKQAEANSQQSVSWWTKTVRKDLDDENTAAQNLGKQIDNLASKNSKLKAVIGNNNTIHGLPTFAGGVQNFQGGAAIVGEDGPEIAVFPPGTDILPADQTSQMLRGGSTPMSGGGNKTQQVNIQQVVITTAPAATEFFRQLDQDSILAGKGLALNRGSH